MNIRPSTHCCGCASLTFGVEMISLWYLISAIACIAIVSSVEPLVVSGVGISPGVQVLSAAWSLIGIPIILGAGVGALYRVEAHLRVFFMYMVVNFIFGALVSLYFLYTGAICNSAVAPDVQRMGAAFVCGFTDTFAFMWQLIFGIINLYYMYIVWSAAEEIAKTPYPELVRYTATLRTIKQPGPPTRGDLPIGSKPGVAATRSEAAIAAHRYQQESMREQSAFKAETQNRSSDVSFGGSYGGYGGVTYTTPAPPGNTRDSVGTLQAQSFVPSPQSYSAPQSMEPRYMQAESIAHAIDWRSAPAPATVNTLSARPIPVPLQAEHIISAVPSPQSYSAPQSMDPRYLQAESIAHARDWRSAPAPATVDTLSARPIPVSSTVRDMDVSSARDRTPLQAERII